MYRILEFIRMAIVKSVQRGQQSFLVGRALNPLHDGGIIGRLDELLELRGLDGGEITGRSGGGSGRSSGLRFRGLTTDLGLDDGTEDEDAVSRKDGTGDCLGREMKRMRRNQTKVRDRIDRDERV